MVMGNIVGRQIYISSFQREVIDGTILGDGRIECRSKGIRVFPKTARIRIHQGESQKDYLYWKYQILRDFVSQKPKRIICGKNHQGDKNYYSWYFHTITIEFFGELYQQFYLNGYKIVPKDISHILTPLSLAVWYMDDGCFSQGTAILNTQNFSFNEQKILQKSLKEKFNLKVTINKDRNRWRLRIKKEDFSRFSSLIKDYIIPSMRYKIVPVETESVRTR
jgi:recombination protein RecA